MTATRTVDEWVAWVREHLDEVDVTVASEQTGAPEAAWGDVFVSHADGTGGFPFMTIVTQDQPGSDERSRLDEPDRYRINIRVGRARAKALLDTQRWPPADLDDTDVAAADVLLPHPVYAAQGYVCVVCPGARTTELVEELAVAAQAR